MESLVAEISNKRKAIDDGGATSQQKYMRRADVQRAKEEAERKKKAEEDAKVTAEKAAKAELRADMLRKDADKARVSSLARLANSPLPKSTESTPEPSIEREAFNISPEECIRRLRAKMQPIRLFGESDNDRRLRLRALELAEDRGHAGRHNEFARTMQVMEQAMEEKELERMSKDAHKGGKTVVEAPKKDKKREIGILDLSLVKADPAKLYPIIYWALKNTLIEWEEWMDDRPEDIKRSMLGKNAAANMLSSKDSLKPLFKSLRSRDLPNDVLRHLSEIVHYMQTRCYSRANDAYLRMSIGNAAWPIGVTSVGIHERSAREKIGQDNIAHVLNDEVSRKYIQAVKRLLTFSQTVRPPYEATQLMG